jgi:DNA mismatch repair protein MutL
MPNPTSSIQLLPQSVIEKIAAGEVIERPASVLKELIENSIDAGATLIDVTIEEAGFLLIKVVDNGSGMGQKDLAQSVVRHATSKIRTADDLFAVTTLGFRGEALASIAAVSRLRIATAADGGGLGFSLTNNSDGVVACAPVAHARGTTVEVRDLFYNVPARKKFMKSARSEQLALVRVVEQVAVPFPLIHFTVTVSGKRLLDLPTVDSPLARIASIAGTEFAKGLIECRSAREGMETLVYVSSPSTLQERPRYQSLYVNLRRVDCDSVTYSIREAFEQFLGGKYRPAFFCFLDVDPSRIDVNVHPTKQEVKFEDERSLFGFIFASVKQGIGSRAVAPEELVSPKVNWSRNGSPTVAGGEGSADRALDSVQQNLAFPLRKPPPSRFPFPAGPMPTAEPPESDPYGSPENAEQPAATEPDRSASGQTILPFPTLHSAAAARADRVSAQESRSTEETAWDLISCYQIHETYILAPIKNGIVLIDQHAAHERVLFEQATEDIERGRSPSQQLLFPVVIELTALEKGVVLSGQSFFTAFGFEVNEFSGNAVSVSAIPFFMKTGETEETVRRMVAYLLEEKERDALRETEKRFAAAFACGAAIKAGQKLTQEEMNALVNSLFATGNPYICPHGRPTLVRISLDELSRRFLR